MYRADTPQEGRFREFYQFDADIMFAPDVVADSEIIAMMVATMQALGITEFIVKVNNRKIAEGIPELIGLDSLYLDDLLKIMDKRDKIGRDGVVEQLQASMKLKENAGLELTDDQVDKLMTFAEAAGSFEQKLSICRSVFAGIDIAEEGINELEEIAGYLDAMGVPEDKWEFDFSVVRGLAYYTGPVFETQLTNLKDIGSVFSGGRFDNLVGRFSDATVPGTGASVGVDRLLAALIKLGQIEEMPTSVQCLMMRLSEDNLPEMKVVGQLREAGINTMVYTGAELRFSNQLNRAVKFGIPVVVIIGENELSQGMAAVKNMNTREQELVPLDKVADFVSGILSGD